jgi:fibronectin type 3 domain-containing protein
MKKVRALLQAFLLTGALALGLAACGGSGSSGNNSPAGAALYAAKSWANVTVVSGDQQVTLTWADTIATAGSSATSYNVYYGTSPGVKKGGAGVTRVANGTSHTFVHSGLQNDVSYYYVITAVSPDGSEGVESREASATPQAAVPAALTGITIKAGDGQNTLSFDQVAGQTYNVYWAFSSSEATKVKGTKIAKVTSPFVHNSLASDGKTTYYYVVTYQGTGGSESAESRQLSAAPLTQAADASAKAPTSVSASDGNGQVTISWTGTPDASSYLLYWWTGTQSNKANKIVNAVSPFVHQSLANGTTYHYIVSAVQTDTNIETDSAPLSIVPSAKTPAVPAGLAAAAQPQQVLLSWKKDTSGDAVTYNLFWSTDLSKDWNKISNIAASSYTHTGLTSGLTYYYKVSAQSIGESSPSNPVSATP